MDTGKGHVGAGNKAMGFVCQYPCCRGSGNTPIVDGSLPLPISNFFVFLRVLHVSVLRLKLLRVVVAFIR